MQPSLKLLVEELRKAAEQAEIAAENGLWNALREAARRALSAASKMHGRAAVMCELEADEKFVADVMREARPMRTDGGPEPIRGDTPLPFPPPAPRGKRGTSPRKPKG